ncbi:MAG TPA: 30S ribosomal protein S5 [Thermotoga sp.]|uniref:Small ribosomal subunit protein uS5 n=3 Tax=Thermotogaceae TaxID=188709 RepID=RS5_THEP1|nr:RecName: Full=Small ribosomal subunit protein uS5; AltName: Full=30S ribosomal protein S5 [Thermotoga petrophila RKU-1]B1LBM3.1 RecName: Full=Small ribosomal subunit protein uS5; AltName: Full=30S ribosomal protein S5 [Thermotoga sp. RQ2]AIY88631.1 30S ribosomal protein S5 [Thermotoga sp. Cell2]KHC94231.1 30S ribosomal protein S5 [Thermotoga sp. TBGT1765]KHC94799.1 30S ribosomal protein S5 [Thermotoga sp. TBGT1766]KHC95328.1 30S ribosomal protein S5 [Thermotoga sp. Xyl54]MBZ4661290.1 ribos
METQGVMKEIQYEEFEEKIIEIRRTSKVTKGGKNLSFRVVAIVGNKNGKVGLGIGKAREVPEAIRKAISAAKRNIIEVPVINGTIPHEIIGRQDASKVLLRPAAPGTGIIAGGTVRAVVELAGIQNILTKSLGSTNPLNLALATMNGLKNLLDPRKVAKLRDISVEEVFKGVRREDNA